MTAGEAHTVATGDGTNRFRRLLDLAVGILLAVSVGVTFRPLTSGGFFLDDFVRLYDLANYGVAKLLITPHGGHVLVASNGAYALFWRLFGLAPHRWLACAVALHALNAVLLFVVLRRLGCRTLLAGTMAALWALCPVQAGAVGWMAVFGQVLLATIMLLWLSEVAGVAARGAPVSGWRLACWVAFGLLAATSFAIGIGLAMVLWLAAPLMLPITTGRRRVAWVLGSLVLLVPAVYVVLRILYARLFDVTPFMVPHVTIPADAGELVRRLGYAGWLVLDFLVYGASVLSFGWLAMSPGVGAAGGIAPDVLLSWLILPAALLFGLASWALASAPTLRRSQAIGFLLLATTAYGTVAFGAGASARVESEAHLFGWTPARAVADVVMIPRYHYVATLLLTAALALAVAAAANRTSGSGRAARALLVIVLASLVVRSRRDADAIARLRTTDMLSGATRRLADDVEHAQGGHTVYLPNHAFGTGFLALHADSFPGRAAVLVITHPSGVVDGKTVRFVEEDPHLLAVLRAQTGTPIARLVVAPDGQPPSPARKR